MDRVARSNNETARDLASLPKMLTLSVAAGLTYQMKPNDFVLIVDTTNAGGDGVAIVTLPSLAEAVGNFYCIKAPVGVTADLSLYEKETGAELTTYGDMDANNDQVILFSNGVEWIVAVDLVA